MQLIDPNCDGTISLKELDKIILIIGKVIVFYFNFFLNERTSKKYKNTKTICFGGDFEATFEMFVPKTTSASKFQNYFKQMKVSSGERKRWTFDHSWTDHLQDETIAKMNMDALESPV